MNRRRLDTLLAAFRRVRIVVIGDVMLDRFVWGSVERISPEAPVPVVHVSRQSVHPGGAGNVVANISALGGRVEVVGLVGADSAGRELRAGLAALGAGVAGIVADRRVVSTEKTRIIAHGQQLVRFDHETPEPPAPAVARVARAARALLAGADAVVVSDYGKGAVGPALLATLAAEKEQRGFVYVIDPKAKNYGAYRGASLVKPNAMEAAQAAGIALRDGEALDEAGRILVERWQCEGLLISRGEQGMSLYRDGRAARHFPTAAREVFDVTGAGDTAIAVASLVLAAGGSHEEAALLANRAAGVVVGKVGTATVSPAELRTALAPVRRGAGQR